MILKVLPGQGLLVDQAPLEAPDEAGRLAEVKARHVDAIEQAEAWLIEQGTDPWEIAEYGLAGRIRRAWYHDEFGFVPGGWEGEGARSVLVVHLPVPEEPDAPPPPPDVEVIDA